jgi:hypothetical protein
MSDPKLTTEQLLRMKSVQLAIELTLKDEALFAGSTISFADRIYQFIKEGTVDKTPIKG